MIWLLIVWSYLFMAGMLWMVSTECLSLDKKTEAWNKIASVLWPIALPIMILWVIFMAVIQFLDAIKIVLSGEK